MAERAAQLKNALAPKATESAYAEELKIVKGALRCKEHDSANQWCYVSPGHGKKHIALGLTYHTLSMTAKLIESVSLPQIA